MAENTAEPARAAETIYGVVAFPDARTIASALDSADDQ